MSNTPPEVSAYFSKIGRKGGKKSGAAKKRGTKEYYKRIAKKRWKKEKADV